MKLAKFHYFLAMVVSITLGVGTYITYNILFVENLFIEKTSGTYSGFSIGTSKQGVFNELTKYLPKVGSKYTTEIKLSDEGGQNVIFLSLDINQVNVADFAKFDTWVIYICKGICDWRKENHWISFIFEDDRLIRIAEYEKRKWELP